MSKKFEGKICVYCLENLSTKTGDHVFAREFFLEKERNNLPKVPACKKCNDEKSKLEHYLVTILPFGARHNDSLVNLETKVPPRLKKNVKLHHELLENIEKIEIFGKNNFSETTSILPFKSDYLEQLFCFIVKGLMYYHWNIYLKSAYDVKIIFPENTLEEKFSSLLNKNSNRQVTKNLGSDTFLYEGRQGTDYPEFSVWKFQIYNGVHFSDNNNNSQIKTENLLRDIIAVTAKKEFLKNSKFLKLFN